MNNEHSLSHNHSVNTDDQNLDHSGHKSEEFKIKFWFCLVLTIPVIVYSKIFHIWFNVKPIEFIAFEFIPLIFSSLIMILGGMVFIKGAINEIKVKSIGMMTLISLAIVSAYLFSLLSQFIIRGEDYYWELSSLITIMLLGHWIEIKVIQRVNISLDELKKLIPETCEKIINNLPTKVKVSELKINDQILIRPGSTIPVDGTVKKGSSFVNQFNITGESNPIVKNIGDKVIASSINQDGSLIVRVTELGEDTVISGIIRLVEKAKQSKSKVQILADKAAFWLTLISISISLLTFSYWLFNQDLVFALERAVAVLVVACPHALGLAIPLVVYRSSLIFARNGILITKRPALEIAKDIDTVVLDKTGTLTTGELNISNVWVKDGLDKDDILLKIASLEQFSEHGIGKVIVKAAKKNNMKLITLQNFNVLPGIGVSGNLENYGEHYVVNFKYLADNDIEISNDLKNFIDMVGSEGKTTCYLINKEKELIGAIALSDSIRTESKELIMRLKQNGNKVIMVTGDNQGAANYISNQLNIDKIFYEVQPNEKASIVEKLQNEGEKVCFIGDGINDAPALTTSDVGIAIGAGTDIAIDSSDIILVNNNLLNIPKVIQISKITFSKMVQNLIWAIGYNVITIPLASGLLYGSGIVLSPMVGAVLMTLSTILVVINAMLLRDKDEENYSLVQ